VLEGEKPPIGLRERKKAKTRAAIQHHALRLFREHGYEETTVEQIAEAAEVSESTLYRYFPTKEDLVLWDEFDPLLIEAFRAQPPELTPLEEAGSLFVGQRLDGDDREAGPTGPAPLATSPFSLPIGRSRRWRVVPC
jgi:hypothetical protein